MQFKVLLVVAALVASVVGVAITPSPARAVGEMTFLGQMTVNPGLSWPATGNGRIGSWALSGTFGSGVSSTGDAGLGTISLAGSIHAAAFASGPLASGAFCGASGGSGGTGSFSIGASSWSVSNFGWLNGGPGGFFHGEGDVTPGGVVGHVVIDALMPPPSPAAGTGSCAAGTATSFLAFGILTFTA